MNLVVFQNKMNLYFIAEKETPCGSQNEPRPPWSGGQNARSELFPLLAKEWCPDVFCRDGVVTFIPSLKYIITF